VSAEGVDLIARIAQGDREAFSRFYDAFAPLAFGVIRRIVQQPGDAEDVLQEVFWEIWRLSGRYEPARERARGLGPHTRPEPGNRPPAFPP